MTIFEAIRERYGKDLIPYFELPIWDCSIFGPISKYDELEIRFRIKQNQDSNWYRGRIIVDSFHIEGTEVKEL